MDNLEYVSKFTEDRMELLNFILNAGYFYIFFAILFFILFLKIKNKKWKVFFISISACFTFLIYGQFFERFWIKTNFINLNKGWDTRVVLISDQHLGVYKDANYMRKVVKKINEIKNVDMVLVAGDLTYWPKNIEKEHSVLGEIKSDVYVALGNHDVVQSGFVSFAEELDKVLKKNNVKILYNEKIKTKKDITIFGLGSLFAHEDDVSFLKNAEPETEKTILLFHNPDTTRKDYPTNKDFSDTVTFAGHTHCGQVRIPFIYKYVIPTTGNFFHGGVYDLKEKGKLVITCGLGESGIPIRIFNRPEILVVDL